MSVISDLVAGGMQGLLGEVDKVIEDFHLPPEKAAQLEQARLQAQADLTMKLEQLAAQDRDSARQREMQVKDPTPHRLAYMTVGGFLALGAVLVAQPMVWPAIHLDTEQATLVGALLGYFASEAKLVMAYYFGSSSAADASAVTLGKIASS